MNWEADFYGKAHQLYEALGTIDKLKAENARQRAELDAYQRTIEAFTRDCNHWIQDFDERGKHDEAILVKNTLRDLQDIYELASKGVDVGQG